jgi:hypothetical protein
MSLEKYMLTNVDNCTREKAIKHEIVRERQLKFTGALLATTCRGASKLVHVVRTTTSSLSFEAAGTHS